MGKMKELGMEKQQAAESKERFTHGDKVRAVWVNDEFVDVEFLAGPSGSGDTYKLSHETLGLMYVNANCQTFEGIFERPTDSEGE